MPTSGSSIACWPRRAMASAGAGTGSTSSATPRRWASSSTTTCTTPGGIATTSFGPSMPTCLTTSSSIEHLAGDLVPQPRRHPIDGTNESILATGFFWMREGKQTPVDIRQEQADRIDNQTRRARQGVSGPDDRLRPLPRSQVRRDLDQATITPWPAISAARGYQQAFIDPPESMSTDRGGVLAETGEHSKGSRPERSLRPGSSGLASSPTLTAAAAGQNEKDESKLDGIAKENGVDPQRLRLWVKAIRTSRFLADDHPLARPGHDWQRQQPKRSAKPIASESNERHERKRADRWVGRRFRRLVRVGKCLWRFGRRPPVKS